MVIENKKDMYFTYLSDPIHCCVNITVKQRIVGKRHRRTDDSLMVTSMCDVRNCETSQVALMNFHVLLRVKFSGL